MNPCHKTIPIHSINDICASIPTWHCWLTFLSRFFCTSKSLKNSREWGEHLETGLIWCGHTWPPFTWWSLNNEYWPMKCAFGVVLSPIISNNVTKLIFYGPSCAIESFFVQKQLIINYHYVTHSFLIFLEFFLPLCHLSFCFPSIQPLQRVAKSMMRWPAPLPGTALEGRHAVAQKLRPPKLRRYPWRHETFQWHGRWWNVY